jgi:hypothetical protein
MHPLVVGGGILVVLAGSWAGAQPDPAAHRVSVTIPQVLRLRLDGGARSAVGEVPIRVRVDDGRLHLDPPSTRLAILANGAWQLTVAFTPDAASGTLPLLATVDGAAPTRLGAPQALLAGAPTRGWVDATVRYGLAYLPADGTYGGVVTFTLARP